MARNDTCIPENYQPMHVQTLQYSLDDVRGIDDPRGMRGRDLSVDHTLVCGMRTSLANLREALALNHLETDRFLHSAYASGLAHPLLRSETSEVSLLIWEVYNIDRYFHGRQVVYVDTIKIGAFALPLTLPVYCQHQLPMPNG